MKKFLLAIFLLTVPALTTLSQERQQARRPNILLILADDFGAESSALYPQLYNAGVPSGFGQVPTPTLSALASRGLVFDNVWATPLCSPTRGAILSGLYGHNTGVTTVGNVLPGRTTSIFELIGASQNSPRYGMGAFGKWHLGGGGVNGMNHVVTETGVPVFKGFLGAAVLNYYSWTVDSSTSPSTNTTAYSTTAITDFAIDFIRNQKDDEPWFAYVPYNAPHGTSANDGFQIPPANLFSVNVGGRPAGDPRVYNGDIPVYQAIVQSLDTEIGRLFRAMAEAGELDDTVIIFLGDNGTPAPVKDRAASRIRGSKWDVYEGGVRVPMIVAGPGVTRSGRVADLVATTDLYATVAQLAGVPLTNNTINNSYSLVPLFSNDKAASGRNYSFTELCGAGAAAPKQFAIRDQRYKLLFSANAWQMFDLENDPWETTNLYLNAEHSKARSALLTELTAMRMKAATNGCFVDIPSP